MAFDSKNPYIAALCHDRGRSGVVVNDIRDFPTGEQVEEPASDVAMRLKGAVTASDKYTAPATLAALSVG